MVSVRGGGGGTTISVDVTKLEDPSFVAAFAQSVARAAINAYIAALDHLRQVVNDETKRELEDGIASDLAALAADDDPTLTPERATCPKCNVASPRVAFVGRRGIYVCATDGEFTRATALWVKGFLGQGVPVDDAACPHSETRAGQCVTCGFLTFANRVPVEDMRCPQCGGPGHREPQGSLFRCAKCNHTWAVA